MRSFASWSALVTGASSGIGCAIARELASEVESLTLVARRTDRLETLSKELRARRPELRVTVMGADLASSTDVSALVNALASGLVTPDIFVNNAGIGVFGPMAKADADALDRMMAINVVAAGRLLRAVVPGMLQRGRGAILNVGSTAGIVTTPGFAHYGATKAFLNYLSETLSAELRGTQVTSTALCPGPVPTEFQALAGTAHRRPVPKAFEISQEQCAKKAIRAMRLGKTRIIPGSWVAAGVGLAESAPRAVVRAVMASFSKPPR